MSIRKGGKRIVMVAACPFPANHGSPASIREMSEALVDLDNEVHIVTYPISEDIPVHGARIHRVPRLPFMTKSNEVKVGPTLDKLFFNPMMVFRLIWIIWRYRIDVIHAHNYEGILIAWLAKLITRRPILYNAVNSMADELPTYDFFSNKNFARKLAALLDGFLPFRGDYVTAVSDDLKDFLTGIGINRAKVTVLPAGVFPEMFDHGDPSVVAKRHNLDPDKLYMAYAGSLDSFQRIDYLLETAAIVMKKNADARLMMIGNIINPDALAKYEQQAEALGIADKVLFLEQVALDDLSDYLAFADIAVIPRPECPGHPVKVLNYMSAKKAIAGFEGGAKGLTGGHDALIADNHDVEGLAAQILVLMSDPALRHRLGEQARSLVDQYYTWGRLVQGYDVIYEYLLKRVDEGEFRGHLSQFVLDSYSPGSAECTVAATN